MSEGWLTRLESAVRADGRSPRAISLAVGLGPNYLGEILKNGKEPGIEKLVKLANELQVSVSYLLTGSAQSPDSEEMLTLLASMERDDRETMLALARKFAKGGQR